MNTAISFISHSFIELLNISITASWIVLALCLVRKLFGKVPKSGLCVLWGIAGLRLILPFQIESIFSLIPSRETFPSDVFIGVAGESVINPASGQIPAVNIVSNPLYSDGIRVGVDAENIAGITDICGMIWIAGVILMLGYAAVSTMMLKRKVAAAFWTGDNVKQCEFIGMPFLLGVFRPVIYLPCGICDDDKRIILAHEQAHIKRKDHIWKPLGFFILSIYWFNPVLWIGYILLCTDIEAACDEKVISELGDECRQDYSRALLGFSVSRRIISACPVAFGEGNVKGRIVNIMNYKKPTFRIILIFIVLCVILAVCFLTSPKKIDSLSEYDDNSGLLDTSGEVILTEGSLLKVSVKISRPEGGNDTVEIRYKNHNVYTVETDGCFVRNAYFCDMNSDGKPELCFSAARGAGGTVNCSVFVCDISDSDNIKEYRLYDPKAFDYVLDMEKEKPYVNIYSRNTAEVYASGKLILKGEKLFINSGTQVYSGQTVADMDALAAKYADISEFDFSENPDGKNDLRSIIESNIDIFYALLSSNLDDVSKKCRIIQIDYIGPDSLDELEPDLTAADIENAVILSDSSQFAVFACSYYREVISDGASFVPQYPSGEYTVLCVLGRVNENDSWKLIRRSVPRGIINGNINL